MRMPLAVAMFCLMVATAGAETVYTIDKWPDGLANVPCNAFVKQGEGTWAQTGTIIVESSNSKMGHNVFKGGKVASILEEHCGKK